MYLEEFQVILNVFSQNHAFWPFWIYLYAYREKKQQKNKQNFTSATNRFLFIDALRIGDDQMFSGIIYISYIESIINYKSDF